MSRTYSAGVVTAYGAAKRGGYTGTYEQFCQALGDLAEQLENLENLSVTVSTLPAGSSATASYADGVLTLGIPKGDTGATGPTGPQGPAATVEVGTVTTLPAGSSATVTNSGSSQAAVFNFGIPKGDTGEVSQADFDELSDSVEDLKTAIHDGILQTDVDPEWVGAYVNTSGVLKNSSASGTAIVPLQKGQTITVGTANSNICIIGSTTASTLAVGDTITVIQKTTTGSGYEVYSYTAPSDMNAVICVALANYEAYISEDTYAKKSIANQTLYGTDDYIDQFNSALLKVYKLKTGNTMNFGWISDSHDKSGFSAANTLNILNKLSQKSGCGFIANTGDIIDGGSTAENNYPYFLNYWKYASQTDLPILYALGHHELYGVNKESGLVHGTDTTGIPRAVIEGTGNGYIKLQNVAFDANNKSNYYVDLPNGYRVIVIDSIYGTNSARGYTSDTMSFVSNSLDSQKVNIILAHVPPLSGLLYPVLSVYNGNAMHNILKVFVANGGTVIYFHGHTHLDYADVIDGVPYIAIACASAHQTTDATYTNGYGDAKGWARAKGTYTEFLFDIVTVNPNTKTINLTRFGAGEDRSLTY